MFSCEFCEISKNTFFTEHLCATASGKIIVQNHLATFCSRKLEEILHLKWIIESVTARKNDGEELNKLSSLLREIDDLVYPIFKFEKDFV